MVVADEVHTVYLSCPRSPLAASAGRYGMQCMNASRGQHLRRLANERDSTKRLAPIGLGGGGSGSGSSEGCLRSSISGRTVSPAWR